MGVESWRNFIPHEDTAQSSTNKLAKKLRMTEKLIKPRLLPWYAVPTILPDLKHEWFLPSFRVGLVHEKYSKDAVLISWKTSRRKILALWFCPFDSLLFASFLCFCPSFLSPVRFLSLLLSLSARGDWSYETKSEPHMTSSYDQWNASIKVQNILAKCNLVLHDVGSCSE